MKRLPNGLVEGIEYQRDENGRINWFRMIPSKFLYINQEKKNQIEKRLGKKVEEADPSEMLDTDYVINAQGIRYLLDLRGYKASEITLGNCAPDYASATCRITFIAHEDEPEKVFAASASAHPHNTKSWYQNYLVEASSNRAQARAVRFFLGLNCVAQEELGGAGNTNEPEQPVTANPTGILKIQMGKAGKSFNDILEILKSENVDVSKITSVDKIPPNQIYRILGKLS